MKHKKILNLLNEASDLKFMTRNILSMIVNIVNEFSNTNYREGNEII